MTKAAEIAIELCITNQPNFHKVCEQAAHELVAQEREISLLTAHREILRGALNRLLETVPPYRENGEPSIPDATVALVNDALRIAKETKE